MNKKQKKKFDIAAHEELIAYQHSKKGGINSIIDKSVDLNMRVLVSQVIHHEPQEVLNYILSETKGGLFKRTTISNYASGDGNRHALSFWQHTTNEESVEFLINLNHTSTSDTKGHILEISSVEEEELERDVVAKLAELRILRKGSSILQRAILDGTFHLVPFEFGQTALTLVGTLGAEEITTETITPSPSFLRGEGSKSRVRKTIKRHKTSFKQALATTLKSQGDKAISLSSIRSFVNFIEEAFHNPTKIDERRKRYFVEHVIPNAPSLTTWEDMMLDKAYKLRRSLVENGERLTPNTKDKTLNVEKFMWTEVRRAANNHVPSVELTQPNKIHRPPLCSCLRDKTSSSLLM